MLRGLSDRTWQSCWAAQPAGCCCLSAVSAECGSVSLTGAMSAAAIRLWHLLEAAAARFAAAKTFSPPHYDAAARPA